MAPFYRTNRQLRDVHLGACIAAMLLAFALPTCGQTDNQTDLATLQGVVRDSRNQPLGGISVLLKNKDGVQTQAGCTDPDGHYSFSVPEGTYTISAEMPGYGRAMSDPLLLKAKDTKTIDLKFEVPSAGANSKSAPDFFDEPRFTIAGVSDTTNLGGHGSDVIVRNTAALARDTSSLGREKSSRDSASSIATENSLREQVKGTPDNFEANAQLGKCLVDAGKPQEAISYLEHAAHLNPGNYENKFALALARRDTGDYQHARADVQALLADQDRAELHHLLADVEEKQGNPVEAVRQYQRAVELNPSEPNLFDWGTELLVHAAPDPALDVFTRGHRLFPRSSRMLVGLGVALYARGSYEQAVMRLCEASDLKPDDPNPYFFLGKLQTNETLSSANCVNSRLERFAKLQPENALANYYYATSLWNSRGQGGPDLFQQVQVLLEKSVHLDPKLGLAYLALGNVYAEQKDLPKAVSAYKQATETSPQLAQAHYRLAQAYRKSGDDARAQQELKLYEQVSRENAERTVRERRELQEFVYTLRDPSPQAQ